MDDTNLNKSQAKGEGSVKEERNVTIGMEILKCSVCRVVILSTLPKIYQCSCGHLACRRCHSVSPDKMCTACSGPFSQRSYGVERVFKNVTFPCKYECGWIMGSSSWYIHQEHESTCLNGPASCPLKSWAAESTTCDFFGPKPALLDHISTVHKWPTTSFSYDVPFNLPAEPGSRLLRSEDDHHIFLLTVSDSLHNGHCGVYIQTVGRFETHNEYGCSVHVTWDDSFGRIQHRYGSCVSMALRDHAHQDCLCIFRERSDLKLKITMQKLYGYDYELDEEEDRLVSMTVSSA